MPVPGTCSRTVLTGQDGLVTMRPPGTLVCLKDYSDFPAGTSINVPATCDFRVGDPVVFRRKGSAQLESNIQEGALYYVTARPTPTAVRISNSLRNPAIFFYGDGGTGTADTPGEGNHIEMQFAIDQAMCEVASVTLAISRGEIDKTAIPCKPSSRKMARFRSYQPGFAQGSGVLTIRLVEDLAAFNNRLIQGVLFNNQAGAVIKSYFNAVAANGAVYADDSQSLYSELPVILTGFNTRISRENAPTELAINFRISGQPANLFGSGTLTPPPEPPTYPSTQLRFRVPNVVMGLRSTDGEVLLDFDSTLDSLGGPDTLLFIVPPVVMYAQGQGGTTLLPPEGTLEFSNPTPSLQFTVPTINIF